ncbi:MAG: protein kinase [Verrucomicrobia bacterium]|nr:protein kinase [Verrucomicrobiota bacterium]
MTPLEKTDPPSNFIPAPNLAITIQDSSSSSSSFRPELPSLNTSTSCQFTATPSASPSGLSKYLMNTPPFLGTPVSSIPQSVSIDSFNLATPSSSLQIDTPMSARSHDLPPFQPPMVDTSVNQEDFGEISWAVPEEEPDPLYQTFISGSWTNPESADALTTYFRERDLDLGELLGYGRSGGVYHVKDSLTAFKHLRIGVGAVYNASQFNLNNGDAVGLSLEHASIVSPFKALYYKDNRILELTRYHYCDHSIFENSVLIGTFMPMIHGKNLLEVLSHGPMDPRQAARIGYQLLCGLEYMQIKNVLHRDVKPDNILIDERGNAKWIDFGLSVRVVKNEYPRIGNDNELYVSPKFREYADARYDYRDEAWSMGLILLRMVGNYSSGELIKMKQNNSYLIPGALPPDFRRAIYGLLQTDPSQRLSASQARILLSRVI